MKLYGPNRIELLNRLLHKANPDMTFDITEDNVIILRAPTANAAKGKNTTITLNGVMSKGLIGKFQFNYDRLDIGTLYNGITITFNAANHVATHGDLLPDLNERLGLNLVLDDLASPNVALGRGINPTAISIPISSKSLCWQGTLKVTWHRSPVGYFPDSGPGNKYMLYGDMNAGYFGTVSIAEFTNSIDILSQMNKYADTFYGSAYTAGTFYYVKFAWKGDFYFVPNVEIIRGISFDQLYSLGALYPSSVTTHRPSVAQDPVPQNRVLELDRDDTTYQFKIEATAPSLIDPMTVSDPMKVPDAVSNMYSDIFAHLYTGSNGDGLWDTLGSFNVGYNTLTWLTSGSDATRAIVTMPQRTSVSETSKTAGSNVRPAFKLVPYGSYVQPLTDVDYKVVGKLRKPLLVVNSSGVSGLLQRVTDIEWVQGSGDVKRVVVTFETPVPLSRVKDLNYSTLGSVNVPKISFAITPLEAADDLIWERSTLKAPPLTFSITE